MVRLAIAWARRTGPALMVKARQAGLSQSSRRESVSLSQSRAQVRQLRPS